MEGWVFYMLANRHVWFIKPHTLTLRIISGRVAVLLPDVGALACIQGSWVIVEDRMDVDGYTKKDKVNAIECLEGVFPSPAPWCKIVSTPAVFPSPFFLRSELFPHFLCRRFVFFFPRQ